MLPDRCLSVCLSVTLVYCGQTVGWIKMKFCVEVGLGPGHIVLSGNQDPQKGTQPQFSAHFCSSQTAGWIKMPHGTEVGLDPSDIVLDGDPVPSPKETQPPQIFGPCLLGPNGCMHQNTTWYGGTPQPRRHSVRWGPSSPPLKGHTLTQFSARVYCDLTAGWMKTPL